MPSRPDDDTCRDACAGLNRPRLWIAASSMMGLRGCTVGAFDGPGILAWAGELASKGLIHLRLLMTDPELANMRATQEQRLDGAIPKEIHETLRVLRDSKVPADRIRLVRATPTVFAIATRSQMLLNPYPYSAEASRSVTLRVRRVYPAPSDRRSLHTRGDRHSAMHRDIFEQYENRHFIVPWHHGRRLGDDYTIPRSGRRVIPNQAEAAHGTEPPGTEPRVRETLGG